MTQTLSYHNMITGTSLVAQWLRACTSNAEDTGFISGQGTRIPQSSQPKSLKKKKATTKKNPTMIAMLSGAINSI